MDGTRASASCPALTQDKRPGTKRVSPPNSSSSFYWVAITFSQTLGTALGDWMADSTGYAHGAFVFGAGLALLAAAYFWTNVSRVFLFWAAFILTRPLGASVGDFLDKPVSNAADWHSAAPSPRRSSPRS